MLTAIPENYRLTTLDCPAALQSNPKNIKAHFRSAITLLTLNKPTEASDVLFRGLKLEPSNVALKKLNEKVQIQKDIKDLKSRKRQVEEYKKAKMGFILNRALKARNITLRGSSKAPDLEAGCRNPSLA